MRQVKDGKGVRDGGKLPFPKMSASLFPFGCLWIGLGWTGLLLAAAAPSDAWRASGSRVESRTAPASPRPSEAIDRELFAPDPKEAKPGESDAERHRGVSLEAIVEQMVESAKRLGAVDSGPDTQQLQQRILEDLEAILRRARKDPGEATSPFPQNAKDAETEAKPRATGGEQRAASAGPGTRPNPSQAAGKAQGREGEAESPVNRSKLLRRVWGDLPPRQRDEILQFQPPDEFLPEYEAEIEAYFRRLAEGGAPTAWETQAEKGRP